jgi:hypothetical protein
MKRLTYTAGALLCALAASTAFAQAGSGDVDDDGFLDSQDNCLFVTNDLQRDTDGDGIGNACDADLNQDCTVNFVDLGILRSVFFSSDPDADFNGDGQVNFVDLGTMRTQFFNAPGPSGSLNECADTVTIEGRVDAGGVTPMVVVAKVDGSQTDGSVLEFSVTAAVDGSYSLEIFGLSGESYVSLSANESGGPLRLLSDVGSYESLQGPAVSGTVSETETMRTIVSSLSTALALQMEEDQGGPIQSDAQYADARKSVGPPVWLRLAALVQSVIDDPSIELPGTDTLSVFRDAGLRQALRDEILLNHLATRDAAAAALLASLDAPWSASDAVGVVDISIYRSIGAAVGGRVRTNLDGTAEFADANAAFLGTWALTGDGRLQITPLSPVLQFESFPFIEDPDNPGNFIQALQQQFLDQVELVRLVGDEQIDTVALLQTTRTVFPDYPQIPPEVFVAQVNTTATRNAYSASSRLALDTDDLAGRDIVIGAMHETMQALGSTDDRYGYDVYTMNANGTGTTERRGFSFAWSVSPEGVLHIDFANGDSTQFTGLTARGPIIDGIVDGAFAASGDTLIRNGVLVFVDQSDALTLPDVAGTRWRSNLAASAPVLPPSSEIFDWQLSFGGSACRNPFSSSTWSWILNGSRVDIDRAFPPDFIPSWRRSFETFAREGENHWVIETLETFQFDGLTDPGTAAGRINIYSREQTDIGNGNSTPMLIADSFEAAATGTTTVAVRELFANDIDPEGDDIFYMSHSAAGSLGGSLALVMVEGVQGLQYTPPAGIAAGAVEFFAVQATDRVCPVPNGAQSSLGFVIQ